MLDLVDKIQALQAGGERIPDNVYPLGRALRELITKQLHIVEVPVLEAGNILVMKASRQRLYTCCNLLVLYYAEEIIGEIQA